MRSLYEKGKPIRYINNGFAIIEKRQLLHTFLIGGEEILLMSLPDIRDDTDRGGDNGLQAFHLVRL